MPYRSTVPTFFSAHRAMRLSAIAMAAFIPGCAVGPDYQRPAATPMPATYKEAPDGWKVAQPADQSDRDDWWSIYRDARLDDLQTQLNASNQTIAQYAAAYRQARALGGEACASYFPTIGASASATRSGQGAGNRSTSSSSFGQQGSVNNQFSLALDASWEPDLWDSVRRQVAEQKAGQQGAAADLTNARLSAQATLAQTYFQLRALDAQQKLLDETVRAYQQSLRLTQNQYAQGIVARSNVIQAQTQLQSAQASAIDNGGLRGARTEAARAAYDQQIATYRQTVLTAFQDVEDNLASLRILEREIGVQEQAVASANQALAIIYNQYKAGTVAYINVLTAQTTAFTAQQKLASIAGQRMVSSVGLVKALGGGWDAAQMDQETGGIDAPPAAPHLTKDRATVSGSVCRPSRFNSPVRFSRWSGAALAVP